MDDHAFTARTEAVDSTPAASFFVGCSVAPLLGPFRTRKAGATCLACQNSSGAKHRSCTTTKLNGRSCLHCAHRSRGLDPRCKLLCRLLRRTIARAFSHTQSGGNLLGVSKFFRCEAPFLHHHEIEWTIMPSLHAQKPGTRPRLQASLSAAPSHHCSGLFAHAKRGQPAWRLPSLGSPGSRGPLRRHS